MSYDKWKTSNSQDDGWTADEVVACCGMDAFDAVEDTNKHAEDEGLPF